MLSEVQPWYDPLGDEEKQKAENKSSEGPKTLFFKQTSQEPGVVGV